MYNPALYEADDKTFSAPAYSIRGYKGVAWYVLGWETVPDEDTDWGGYTNRTGRVVARMVGDDRDFIFEQEDLEPLDRTKYCSECGQIGCSHGA